MAAALVAASFFQLGTILPEAYPPKSAEAMEKGSQVDPTLDEWLAANTQRESPLELDAKAFENFARALDPTARVFLQLRYAASQQRGEAAALKAAVEYLASAGEDAKSHPLLTYLLEEIIQSSGSDHVLIERLNRQILAAQDRSCPQREAILRAISDRQSAGLDAGTVGEYLQRISSYRSKRFREEAIDAILVGVKDEQKESLRVLLAPHVKEFPKVVSRQPWLADAGGSVVVPSATSSLAKLIDRASGSSRCQSGEKIFDAELASKESSITFSDAARAADVIDSCFRRKSVTQRAAFWRRAEKPLNARFGFEGSELAWRKLGSVEWSVDRFPEAEAAFKQILSAATPAHSAQIAHAIYTLGRITENRGDIAQALAYYGQYHRDFPQGPQREDVLRALVLLASVSGDHQLALQYANTIISTEDQRPVDERAVGTQSFALFWAGRLHMMMKQPDMAEQMWRRVAAEYYSTFYGAIGHYMHEQIKGERIALEPSRSTNFRLSNILINIKDAERAQADRVLELLRVGLKDEASCEIYEMASQGDHPATSLTKALLLYASGEWLQAIKLLDALPRSFRNALPVGFERLLFPKAYDSVVAEYSSKLGVDPDLVLAIIRQESVFNPRAQSGAGARGLMQMMPATARVEAHRLQRSYVPSSRRRQIERVAQNRDALFDPETNVALGVHHVHRLLQRYQNPIFVLTSYNANPKATERWLKSIPTDDFLVFVERIPYMETRLYVKLVLRNYFYYKRWYKSPSDKVPHLDALLAHDLALVQAKKANEQ